MGPDKVLREARVRRQDGLFGRVGCEGAHVGRHDVEHLVERVGFVRNPRHRRVVEKYRAVRLLENVDDGTDVTPDHYES